MRKVFGDAKDKYVCTTVVYANDGVLYAEKKDAEFSKPVNKADAEEIYLKGMTIEYDGQLYKPVAAKVEADKVTITITDGETATSFTSKEAE